MLIFITLYKLEFMLINNMFVPKSTNSTDGPLFSNKYPPRLIICFPVHTDIFVCSWIFIRSGFVFFSKGFSVLKDGYLKLFHHNITETCMEYIIAYHFAALMMTFLHRILRTNVFLKVANKYETNLSPTEVLAVSVVLTYSKH